MAKIETYKPNVINIKYIATTDEEKSRCLWALFSFDLDRYDLNITSDCGNYSYTGWKPTPDRESFLHLCQRLDSGYLLDKLSSRSVFNGKKTWENLKENIEEEIEGLGLEKDWSDYKKLVERACYEYNDATNAYRSIEDALEYSEIKKTISDIWETISVSIVMDYPAGAKTIVDIFINQTVPDIKTCYI